MVVLFVSLAIITVACQKEIIHEDLSRQDVVAIDGMEKSFELAKQYDDSLFTCLDFNPQCEANFVEYCDSLFHHYDERYEHHHNQYSHQNDGDDHHEYMEQNNHGNGMHNDDDHENQGHCIESFNSMEELRENHLNHFH